MVEEDPSRKHFFTDIINSVSRAKYSPVNQNYIISRDYLSIQIWDVRNTKLPFKTFNVTDYLEKKLCEVYESETIFDKFDLQISPDSNLILTGSYNSNAHIIDIQNQTNITLDVKFMDKRGKNVGCQRNYRGKRVQGPLVNAMGEP
jgi:serine/threonine-protein phosphatase 2A regulatory subunit B